MQRNTFARRLLVIVAVIMLSLPSALGVQKELERTRGPVGSWSGAVGIEVLYLGIAVLLLTVEMRKQAKRVARGAVFSAVILNVIFDYREHMLKVGIPNALNSSTKFVETFDPLILVLAILESLPLAGLAYLGSELLTSVAAQEQGLQRPPRRFQFHVPARLVELWNRVPKLVTKAPALPASPGTLPWTASDVAKQLLRGLQVTPGDEIMLRAAIYERKAKLMSATQIIKELFGVNGGPQFNAAKDIYDKYVESAPTNGVHS